MTRALLAVSTEPAAQLEPPLFELVKIRASQINGCACCIDMHTKDARTAGETEQRIYPLNRWRETPFFTDRERAALEWTEAVTRVADTRMPRSTTRKGHRPSCGPFVVLSDRDGKYYDR